MEISGLDLALFIFVILTLRYLVIAGGSFLTFYWFKPQLGILRSLKKIQSRAPARKDYLREVGFSFLTILIFAFISMGLFSPLILPYTQIYAEFNEFGTGYFFLSLIILILFHDTYFYWTHRMMHQPGIFPYFHKVHHLSTNPSPLAAFSFHPLEAVIEIGVIVIAVFIFPLHRFTIMTFIFFMLIYNVYGHLGYELIPVKVRRSRIGKWLNTSTYHNHHHHTFQGNYGLYFTFWDRWMNTLSKEDLGSVKSVS